MDATHATIAAAERTSRTSVRIGHRRRFFAALAAIIAVTVFVGFAPSYLGARPFSPAVHAHGALFTAWILLFLVQTSLVAAGRTALHRKLGTGAAMLVIPMVTSGVWVAIAGARNAPVVLAGDNPFSGFSRAALLAVPLTSMLLFPLLAGFGWFYRRKPETHKRLMLIATIALLPPALGRIPVLAARGPAAFFGVTMLFIVAVLIYDYRTRGRVHAASLWGGLALAASFPGRIALGSTQAWQTFAGWLMNG